MLERMSKERILHKTHVFRYLSLLAGSISMLFIGQEYQIGIFAWFAPSFLLIFTRQRGHYRIFIFYIFMAICGYITQDTHNLFNDKTIGIINSIAYGLIHTIIYMIDRLLYQKGRGFMHTLIFPSIYVVIETLVSSALGTSGVLAQSQFSFSPLAQLSTLTGIFGITFVICWFASVIHWLYENNFNHLFIKKSMTIYGGLLSLVLIYGLIRINYPKTEKQTIKVATISGVTDLHNLVEREKKLFTQLAGIREMKIPHRIFSSEQEIQTQISKTKEAAKSGSKIIVWNEAALILNKSHLNSLVSEIKEISKDYETYISISFFEESSSLALKALNNKSILVGKDGKIFWEYKKSHPTPAEIALTNPGNSIIPYADTEFGRIGNVICYDLDFPRLIQQANNKNIDILLVPAYDWEGFAQMHSKMAQFESLQSGIAIIRANGNGINLITDQKGNKVAELNTFRSDNKILYANLPLDRVKTIYSSTGNIFSVICLLFLIIHIVIRLFLLKRKRINNMI